MRTLRRGDTGDDVARLQTRLNLADVAGAPHLLADGVFGDRTEAAVIAFQVERGLIVDGVAGSQTWDALGVDLEQAGVWDASGPRLGWARVDVDKFGDGYERATLRSDVAAELKKVRDELDAAGAILTTSGGRRRLGANVSATRSAKSLHYTGRAFDLFVGSAMRDPSTDPYVVAPEGRNWRVYARAVHGSPLEVPGWIHHAQRVEYVRGPFVDLTAIMADHGFQRIGRRRNYPESYGAAEWWHFQYERGLVEGVTRFGDELLRVYDLGELEKSAPWKHRGAVWGVDWH